MVSFLFFLLISFSTATRVLSTSQASELSTRQSLISPSSGSNNGYYYNYWSDNSTQEEVRFGSGGSYNVTWSGGALPFLVGKGWNPGSARYDTKHGFSLFDMSPSKLIAI
jgi:endo-1,4-beta-xylanase